MGDRIRFLHLAVSGEFTVLLLRTGNDIRQFSLWFEPIARVVSIQAGRLEASANLEANIRTASFFEGTRDSA